MQYLHSTVKHHSLEGSSLICDESSGDDEESLSSSSLKREGPSSRVLGFVFETPSFGFWIFLSRASLDMSMTAAWNQWAGHRHWIRRRYASRVALSFDSNLIFFKTC
jgi:hypothetical protein